MDEDQALPTTLLNGEPPDQPHYCTPVVSDVTQPAGNSDTAKESINTLGCPSNHHKKTPFKAVEPGLWNRLNEEMDIKVLHIGRPCSSSPVSESSALDRDFSLSSGNYNRQPRADSPPLQALASGTQRSENTAASFRWPPAYQLHGGAEDRLAYFNGLQKSEDPVTRKRAPGGHQAATLLDLMSIRASHSKLLRRSSLGTAVGFRTKQGALTSIPAIIVFVARKVHCQWLDDTQKLPELLEGPGGVWCDVDVVEFAYYAAQAVTPKEQVYTELVEGLRGNDPCIGSGSQVASQVTCGTLGAIVQSRAGARQVGFLTNRHVAVDLDYPSQKMFHPLPPNIGPGVYLGAVERATSFITDNCWYNIFASRNPETFVRADGAFIPFGDKFDTSRVTTTVKGVGDMGDVMVINLQDPISNIVGRQVVKVGRSSGLTKGSIMAYALEYNDEKGICFFTDFLIVGENKQAFDMEGDSGSLILMTEECGKNPRPVGIIWGGTANTANRGRLKLRNGHGPENWTSGVDLGRLLDWLQLDLITSDTALKYAIEEQTRLTVGESTEGECSPMHPVVDRSMDATQHPVFDSFLKFSIQNQNHQFARGGDLYFEELGRIDDMRLVNPSPIEFIKELDFEIPHVERRHTEKEEHGDLSTFKRISNEDLSFDLNLNVRDAKRRRQ